MAWYHRFLNGFRADRRDSVVKRELQFHVDERTDELGAAGMTPSAARHEAIRRLGNRAGVAERTHDVDHLGWFDALRADIRSALRTMGRARALFAVAILSMALGIGANVAIF